MLMYLKRMGFGLPAMMLALLALSASDLFAQKTPSPGTHLTVSKTLTGDDPDGGMFTTIQAAINAAKPNQVIEILDESVYEEQVVIDGRENHPWRGNNAVKNKTGGNVTIVGGKSGITLRYVSSSPNGPKPVIMWRDTVNRSPRTQAEAGVPGDTLGSSGNFETCGALRIIRTTGIKIEGIVIDGGGSRPWAYSGIWGQYPHTFGNAAVAIAVSGNVQIRDCEIRNAFIGIATKDRNTGGVYGNKNPNDNDSSTIIPLSSFGETGYHLFEYNKVHNNDIGVYFEAAWDRGSTVRYNLIYRNYHRSASSHILNNGPAGSGTFTTPGDQDYADGAIKFKDAYLSPVAIYNNTLFENRANLLGGWQVGAQHLVFNNIFGRLRSDTTTQFLPQSNAQMEHRFPNRMKHCLFTADQGIQTQTQAHLCTTFVSGVQFQKLGSIQGTQIPNIPSCQNPGSTGQIQVVAPGVVIGEGGQNAVFAAGSNNRWLETAGGAFRDGNNQSSPTVRLDTLFQSLDPASPVFLEPKWGHALVSGTTGFIEGKGWPDGGIRREDGAIADLGAIQNGGKKPGDSRLTSQLSRARVSPFEVVFINSGTGGRLVATASIKVDQEVGTLTGLRVKYLAFISPIPDNTDKDPGGLAVIPTTSVNVISVTTSIDKATQTVTFDLPSRITAIPEYGFFEIVLEGQASNGKTYTTDVGFLPYRELDYKLQFTVTSPTAKDANGNPMVTAGEPVVMVVKAVRKSGEDYTAPSVNGPLNVAYGLSDAASRMWRGVNPETNPLTRENLRVGTNGAFTQTYTVYFTKAGAEVVSGSGIFAFTSTQMLVFRGTLQLTVNPGTPAKVVFWDPIPKSQLAGNPPMPITGQRDVVVQVQDRYDNPVNTAVPVKITSLTPNFGDVQPGTLATKPTDPATGNATFSMVVTNGVTGNILDMRAELTSAGYTQTDSLNIGALRVGRLADEFKVFYFESATPKRNNEAGDRPGKGGWWYEDYMEKEAVDAIIGDQVPVWVKVVNTTAAGDTVVTAPKNTDGTNKTVYACVAATSPNVKFTGVGIGNEVDGPVAVTFVDGEAKFFVTSSVAGDYGLTVTARTGNSCTAGDEDKGIRADSRSNIKFTAPTGTIGNAWVKGDGNARPTDVYIKYTNASLVGGFQPTGVTAPVVGAWTKADTVVFRWPCNSSAAEIKAYGANITYPDSLTIRATFPDNSAFPEGYSGWIAADAAAAAGLVTVKGALGVPSRSPTSLVDSIGPLIAKARDLYCADTSRFGLSTFPEKKDAAAPDTLRIRINETLAGGVTSLMGNTILMSSSATGTSEAPLNILSATQSLGTFVLIVDPGTPLKDSAWIKINPAVTAVADMNGVSAHADNRRVQIFKMEAAPLVDTAWYTTNNSTGNAQYLYIKFDKDVDDLAKWFVGGSLKFSWVREGSFSITAANVDVIAKVTGEPRTVRVDLARAWPATQAKDAVWTGGGINLAGSTFGTNAPWEKAFSGLAADAARPVLIEARLVIGMVKDNKPHPDTLFVTYSENPRDNIATIKDPVLIKVGGVWTEPDLEPSAATSLEGTPYYVVKYVVNKMDDKVRDGDSVMIKNKNRDDPTAVSDRTANPGNVQDGADNRRVLLKIDLGKLNWETVVKSNPFKSGSGPNNRIVIATSPRAKSGDVRVIAQIKLYDNLGNLVLNTSDTSVVSGSDFAEWEWRGQNSKGRYVGTGTYLFKAVYSAERIGGGGDPIAPWPVDRRIGFVRGLGN